MQMEKMSAVRCDSAYLSEPSDSEQAMHGSGALISVHSAQLSKAQRQVPVAVLLVLIHSNVEGAVHGAQLVHLLLHLHSSVIMVNPRSLGAIAIVIAYCHVQCRSVHSRKSHQPQSWLLVQLPAALQAFA